MKYVFGIDVGGTSVKYGIFQEDGRFLERRAHKTKKDEGYEALMVEISKHIKEFCKDYKLNPNQVIGIGMGLPGPVKDFSTITAGVNIVLEKDFNAAKSLEEKTGFPVIVSNDANVAALGEQWQGVGAGRDSLVLITLGTGVGGGIVVDGKILTGANGASGEIGHMPILDKPSDRTCGCGKKTCLELVCSATAIKATVDQTLAASDVPSTLRNYNGHYDTRAVFMAAENGDRVAEEIVDFTGYYLGKACAIIAIILDPEIIAIGGGVSNGGKLLLKSTRESYKAHVFRVMEDTPIVLASLANNAGIYGAAKMMLNHSQAIRGKKRSHSSGRASRRKPKYRRAGRGGRPKGYKDQGKDHS